MKIPANSVRVNLSINVGYLDKSKTRKTLWIEFSALLFVVENQSSAFREVTKIASHKSDPTCMKLLRLYQALFTKSRVMHGLKDFQKNYFGADGAFKNIYSHYSPDNASIRTETQKTWEESKDKRLGEKGVLEKICGQ